MAGALPPERARSRPLGVGVAAVDPADLRPVPGQDLAGSLPFAGARFDVAPCRHEADDPAEVARVLRPGGRHHEGLNAALAAPSLPGCCLDTAARQVQDAGMAMADAREARGQADVGAAVYDLRAVP